MLIALTPCCARTFLSACLWCETMSLCWLSYCLQSAVSCWVEVHTVLQLGRDVVVALQNTSVGTFFPLTFKKQKLEEKCPTGWEARRKPNAPKADDYKVVWMSSESYSLALVSFFSVLGSLMWLRLALNLFPPLLLHAGITGVHSHAWLLVFRANKSPLADSQVLGQQTSSSLPS